MGGWQNQASPISALLWNIFRLRHALLGGHLVRKDPDSCGILYSVSVFRRPASCECVFLRNPDASIDLVRAQTEAHELAGQVQSLLRQQPGVVIAQAAGIQTTLDGCEDEVDNILPKTKSYTISYGRLLLVS